jgi:nitrogen fixation/metabolism regulation signal transduction histidine kinase
MGTCCGSFKLLRLGAPRKSCATGYMMIATIIVASVLVAIVAGVVAQSLFRPILKLTKLADAMNTEDLETPIEIKSHDEYGKLGEALKRTR